MNSSPYHATLGLAPGGWQLIQHKSNDNLEMRQWQSWRYSAGLWSGDISSTFAELALQVQDHPRCHSGWEKKSTTRFGLCKGWWWAVWPFGQLTLEDTQAEIQKIHFFRLFDGKWTLDHSLVKIIFFLGADCALVPVWRFLPPFPAAWGESRSFRIHTYCIFASLPTLITLLLPRRTSFWPVWLDWGWQWGLESGEGCQPLWCHGQGFLTSHLYFIIVKQMSMNNSWAKRLQNPDDAATRRPERVCGRHKQVIKSDCSLAHWLLSQHQTFFSPGKHQRLVFRWFDLSSFSFQTTRNVSWRR